MKSGCFPVAWSQRMKSTSYFRHWGGTPRRMYMRPRPAVLCAPFAYHVSPQPFPSESRKLYACHVFVGMTTATRLRSPRTVGRPMNGAYPVRPSFAVSLTQETPVGHGAIAKL